MRDRADAAAASEALNMFEGVPACVLRVPVVYIIASRQAALSNRDKPFFIPRVSASTPYYAQPATDGVIIDALASPPSPE